ncbi:MAG: hypothetical protein NVV57_04610 [Demequina sp.]|jgi:hypothetical protein|nr:hypothetical protein [Demequina sp.]
MRRLAQGITGAIALALMMISQPWDLASCAPESCTMDNSYDLLWVIFGTALEVGTVAIILTVVLVGVLGIRDSGRASEAAVYSALGRSQGSAARLAARRGLIDGAVATGIAYAGAGVVNVYLVARSGYQLFEQDSALWVARLVMAVVFTGALTAAHVLDAVRPRRTPVERLHEDAAPPTARRVPLRWRTLALVSIMALGAGVLAGLGLAHDPANGVAGVLAQTLAFGALIGIGLAGLALFFLVGVPLARAAIPAGVRGAASLSGALKATRAAEVVRARATTASGAFSRTVLAIAGLALLAGALCTSDPAPALAPAYIGTMTVQPASAGEDAADELRGQPGVGAVVVGNSYGDWPAAVALEPRDVREVDPALYELLTAHPDAVVAGGGFDPGTFTEYSSQGISISGVVPISTCCMSFTLPANVSGEPPAAGLLIYAAPGTDPAALAATVNGYTFTSTLVTGYGGSFAYSADAFTDGWGALFMIALVLLVCAGPVVALAWGVAVRRRRDDATLAALGASHRTLTAAGVLETTVIAAVAVAAGLLGGAALQTVIGVASRARDSLSGLITDSYLIVLLNSVAWAPMLWIFGGSVIVFAVVAWIARLFGAGRLPAEQLRAVEAGRP